MKDSVRKILDLDNEKLQALLSQVQRQTSRQTKISPASERGQTNTFPQSYAQQQLWFLHHLDPGNTSYHFPFALDLQGELDSYALEQSLSEIVRRHEILRTRFSVQDEQPVQVVVPEQLVSLPIISIDKRHIMEQKIQEVVQTPFDLQQGPLLRLRLFRLNPQEHTLLIVMHHIITDGWSVNVFIQELVALYQAFAHDRPSPLAALPVQYTDFAMWQRQQLQGAVLEDHLAYWTRQLSGELTTLNLPTDRTRPAVPTFRSGVYPLHLSAALTAELKTLCQQEEVSLFMGLLAAFNALLYRYTHQTDILVGTPSANRNRTEIEGLIGFFVNMLVIRTDLSGNPTFRQLLQRVREVVLNAYAHQALPFEHLVEALHPERAINRNPLFQVEFALQAAPQLTIELPGLLWHMRQINSEMARFDLEFLLWEENDEVAGHVVYNKDLFDEQTIRRLVGHYQNLLKHIAAEPAQPVHQFPYLTPRESRQILETWNNSQVEYPRNSCLHQLFEAQVARTPDETAVVCEGDHLTYAQLNRRANQLAHFLAQQGIGPEVIVALLDERGLNLLIAILAVFKAGGAYLPLDPAHPAKRHRQIISQSRCSFILAASQFEPQITAVLENLPSGERPTQLSLEHCLHQKTADHDLSPNVVPNNLAYVIFTSGSTGMPKGAMVTQQGMINHLYAKIKDLSLTPTDRIAQNASQCFDISVWQFWAGLLVGGQVYIVKDEIALDPTRLLSLVNKNRISILELVPSLLQAILPTVERDQLDLPELRWLVLTGEALPPQMACRWLRQYPHVPLFNAYGPTECSDSVSHYACHIPPDDGLVNMSIGKPIANTQLYILDDWLQPTPVQVTGELYVAGDGVGRGYLHNPKRTAVTFIPNPFGEGDILYKTGDLARFLPDGHIEFLGRIDHQVKIRGFRIELGEIEAVLRKHPAIKSTVVTALGDVSGNKRLIAYLVPDGEDTPSVNNLRQYLKSDLPDYMIPAAFVPLKALPLTPNGKINRQALPLPDAARPQLAETFVAPKTDIEKRLAEIWEKVLGITQIGLYDNFFSLGGDSILIIQVVSKARQADLMVTPRQLYENQTIYDLAKVIEQQARKEQSVDIPLLKLTRYAVPPEGVEDVYPLSPTQQGILFHSLSDPHSGVYIEQFLCRLQGTLDIDVFKQAWYKAIERFPILRTSFRVADASEPLQLVHYQASLAFHHDDWRGLSELEQEKRLASYLQEERAQGFDLAQLPLMRVTLLQTAVNSYQLIWTYHHILLDGWSVAQVFQSVLTGYEAICQKQEPAYDASRPYRDYIAWLQQQEMANAEKFWRQMLQGVTAPTSLVVDRSTAGTDSYERIQTRLSTDETAALQTFAQQQQVTLSTVMQAAWALLLGRYNDVQDVIFGITLAGRPAELAGVEQMVGLFINTLPLRVKIETAAPLGEWLRSVQMRQFALQQVAYSPLVEVQKWSDGPRGVPLFESILVLQNYPVDASLAKFERLKITQADTLERTNYPLSIMVIPGSQITIQIGYETRRFTADAIERMLVHLRTLLMGMAANAGQRVQDVPLLPATERQQLLEHWHQEKSVLWPKQSLLDLFAEQVKQTPNSVALVFGEQQLTYAQLNGRANQLAHYLRKAEVGPETVVGIGVKRSLERIIALLAVLKAGGAYLPLDLTHPPERVAYMLQDSQVKVLITGGTINFEDLAAIQDQVDVINLETAWPAIAGESEADPTPLTLPDHLAYIIYTSGSTGQPKGVSVSHRAVANVIQAQISVFDLTRQDKILQFVSFSFDVAISDIFLALVTGGELHITPPDIRLPGAAMLSYLQQHQITFVELPASILAALPVAELPHLRVIVAGGEACPASLVNRWAKNRRFFNAYGPTEAAVCTTIATCQVGQATPPIGRPLRNTEVYLLDSQLQPVPVGVTGELYIGGAGVARGYQNQPCLTAETFIPNPFSSPEKENIGSRLYKTGDLARYRADGQLEYIGRADQQVKLRGFRIEPGEIEAMLNEHPKIVRTAVIMREDTPGAKRLVAYIVPVADADPTTHTLRQFLSERLPVYMIPSAFVRLPELPRLPSGKVDSTSLPMPDSVPPKVETAYHAPQSPTEQTLARIWQNVLQVSQVGIHDNFFELGGDSILSIQIAAQASEAGLALTPKHIFQHQTIAELAMVTAQNVKVVGEQGLVTGSVPLTPIQHWFFEQITAAPWHWNQALLLEVPASLNADRLEAAVQHLMLHHDALRLRFLGGRNGWEQVIMGEEVQADFTTLDVSDLPATAQQTAVETAVNEAQKSLNLSDGPLVKLVWFNFGATQFGRLLVVIHHLLIDGISWRIWLADLQTAYQQLQTGRNITLPSKTTSFKVWSEQLRQYAQSETIQQEQAYWLAQIQKQVSPLPVDYPEPDANLVATSAEVMSVLSISETEALLHEVPKVYRTEINDALLTALGQTLMAWTGEKTLLVDLEGHGREEVVPNVDLTRTVGWFTAVYPVYLEVAIDPGQALQAVKEQLRTIPAHGIGYGLLRYLSRSLPAAPAAEVSFNYLGQLDHVLQGERLFTLASESSGLARSPQGCRSHLLEVNAFVKDGRLHTQWTYNSQKHEHATIQSLADSFVARLQDIVIHCRSGGTENFTPSDFPLANLDDQALGKLARLLNKGNQ